jgi:hypothetical protein
MKDSPLFLFTHVRLFGGINDRREREREREDEDEDEDEKSFFCLVLFCLGAMRTRKRFVGIEKRDEEEGRGKREEGVIYIEIRCDERKGRGGR